MTPPENLLDAVAATLRRRVGPSVEDPFAKTLAFMAAIILEKLAGQLRAAAGDAADAAAAHHALVADLRQLRDDSVGVVGEAVERLNAEDTDSNWSGLIETLYAERDSLGALAFASLLGRVGVAMRARLDRTLEYAS